VGANNYEAKSADIMKKFFGNSLKMRKSQTSTMLNGPQRKCLASKHDFRPKMPRTEDKLQGLHKKRTVPIKKFDFN
jgi:hypothetical protein